MSFDSVTWLDCLTKKIKEKFIGRIVFLGLQGSYGRGEATAKSDIDVVLLLNTVSLQDLRMYREIIASMTESDKACGFIAGRGQLEKWPRYDVFQLYYDTKPLWGSLDDVVPAPGREDAREAVRVGAANLYHAACHCFLYSRNREEDLAPLCKSAFFILQAWHFAQTGDFLQRKQELKEQLSGENKEILSFSLYGWKENTYEICYEKLINWCARLLCEDS